MKQNIIFTVLFLPMAICLFMACSKQISPFQQITITNIARTLAHHGIQKWPDQFTPLVKSSQLACQISKDKENAIQKAFTSIATVIYRDLKDPSLKHSLLLLIESLDIRLDSSLTIITLPPESKELLELLICSFAQGGKE